MNKAPHIFYVRTFMRMAMVFLLPDFAWAQQNLAHSVAIIHNGIMNIPNVISGIFYILGALQSGAILLALPAFGAWVNNSLALGTITATSQSLGPALPPAEESHATVQ